MTRKFFLITFDYELFLGARSGSVKECIIGPTNAIREILNAFGFKAIFFADTTYLSTLQRLAGKYPRCAEDLEQIKLQLNALVEEGHYVFPHLHPHWIDSVYTPSTNQFDLTDVTHYRFHNLSEAQREDVFESSIEVLSSIIRPYHPEYNIQGFRAGGWSVQPISDFLPYFRKHGIRYDFSVLPSLYQFSNAQFYDYTPVSLDKCIYRFGEDVNVPDPEGEFVQITSSVIRIKKHIDTIDKVHRKLLFKLIKDHSHFRGKGQASVPLKEFRPLSVHGHATTDKEYEVASIENLSMMKLPTYLKYLTEHDYMTLVSHPKILTRHNLFSFRQLLNYATRHYHLETDFQRAADYYLGRKMTTV